MLYTFTLQDNVIQLQNFHAKNILIKRKKLAEKSFVSGFSKFQLAQMQNPGRTAHFSDESHDATVEEIIRSHSTTLGMYLALHCGRETKRCLIYVGYPSFTRHHTFRKSVGC